MATTNDTTTNEPQKPATPVSRASDTVWVGCKLPNGYILQTFHMEDYQEQVMGGGTRTAQRSIRHEETYRLCGSSIDIAKMALGDVPNLVIGGYGITSGIPRDYWEKWLSVYKDTPLVKNGLIFAQPDEMCARARAAEGAKLRTGLEPIDPANPGAAAPDVRRVQPGTREAA